MDACFSLLILCFDTTSLAPAYYEHALHVSSIVQLKNSLIGLHKMLRLQLLHT